MVIPSRSSTAALSFTNTPTHASPRRGQRISPEAERLAWLARAVIAVIALTGAMLAGLHFGADAPVQIIKTAVCNANAGQINCSSSGLGGITNAADALVSPILVALFAVSPIACLIGVGAVMVGSRRGIVIIASALGALVLAGAVKGIVA
jgi:hypothetical protein